MHAPPSPLRPAPSTPSASEPGAQVAQRRSRGALLLLAAGATLLLAQPLPGLAGVRFENCQTAPDGSISCDTVPTGNTLMRDEDARFGLLDQASPGWNEFDPYAGYEDDFGGNQT